MTLEEMIKQEQQKAQQNQEEIIRINKIGRC